MTPDFAGVNGGVTARPQLCMINGGVIAEEYSGGNMPEPKFLETPEGRRIAYHLTKGEGPGVLFLGGFRSDMDGTKAVHLENWAKASGRAFLRFDYSGHGSSSGVFDEGAISDWADDAGAVLAKLCKGPQVLVGSSMGGWISLLLAKHDPDLICGLVGIAAASDFTEDKYWDGFSAAARESLIEFGQLSLPSDYGEPLIVTQRLIEDGRAHLVLREPLNLPFATRLLQGTADEDVSVDLALRLLNHSTGPDISLTLVKGADHRFSTPECLAMIETAIEEVS